MYTLGVITFILSIVALCVLCMCAGSDIRYNIYMNSNYTDGDLRKISNKIFGYTAIAGFILSILHIITVIYS
jgi:hypothetical protein